MTGVTVSLRRLWYEYFENTSGSSTSEESLSEDEPGSCLLNNQGDNLPCGNFRPHFTKITKIWQDRRPIRKGSIILRSRKTLFVLLHPFLFNPASQNFLYRLCGWRFLRWRQLAHSFAHAVSCFLAPHHRWHIASSSTWIWTLFKKFSLEGPESEDRWPLIHTKIKKKYKCK